MTTYFKNIKSVIFECLSRGSRNMLKSWIPAFAGMTVLLFGLMPSNAHAEATREIYSDSGIYVGPNSENWAVNVSTWKFSTVFRNADYAEDPTAIEGKKVFWAITNTANINDASHYGGWGIFYVNPINRAVEVPRSFEGFTHIRFWLKSNQVTNTNPALAQDWRRVMKLEFKYVPQGGTVGKKAVLWYPIREANKWQEVVIEIATLKRIPGNADFNEKQITSPFSITAANCDRTVTWEVDHIRWTKPAISLRFSRNPQDIYPGKSRQLLVTGYDASNEPVLVYADFSAPAGVGTVAPLTGSDYTVLRAGSSGGAVTARALGNLVGSNETYVTTTIQIDNNNTDMSGVFGILSETNRGLELGARNSDRNGHLALFSEDPDNEATLPDVFDDSNAPPEKTKSMKVVFIFKPKPLVGEKEPFQGLAFQWGKNDVPSENADTYVKDMSHYYDGSVRFWFKAPAASWNNRLMFGMRSGNVAEGKEVSKSSAIAIPGLVFDNQWHPIVIPIKEFAKGLRFAELSRMKIFFTASIAGPLDGTDASRTVYFDDIRWDTSTPGALARIEIQPNQGATPIFVPYNFRRLFTATGYDSNNVKVDISPTWRFTGASLGTLSPLTGPVTFLNAGNATVQGSIEAAVGQITSSVLVKVENVDFTGATNIYTDAGFRGEVGISRNTETPEGTQMKIEELTVDTGVPEGKKFFRSNFTLLNSAGETDAFAVWFIQNPEIPSYMGGYENGYLSFFVKTNVNLEVSIRSENVEAPKNRAKAFLSEFGVPIDGTWQEVIIPLDYFKDKEPNLDFTQIKTFFSIGGTVGIDQVGVEHQFDVDNVRWLSVNPNVPTVQKVYNGLVAKQQSSGLVRSYDTMASAFTYDQALAAMAYTYHKDTDLAKKVLDVYKNKFQSGNFTGFNDDYHVDTLASRDGDRTAGPNAWILLAMMHYKNVTGSQDYNDTMAGIAAWLKTLQAADGGIRYGLTVDPNLVNVKSTEHNLDVYAAFSQYSKLIPNDTVYGPAARQISTWLRGPTAWNSAEQRFNVGSRGNGTTPNTDKALDVYSWPILVFSSFAGVVDQAETEFGTTKTSNLTGLPVKGFDFSGPNISPDVEEAVDKDAVWLEGTAQMVLAYLAAGNPTKATEYLEQLRHAIFNVSPNLQGITYATNDGTAYGFTMTSNFAAISSDAWYIFAERQFNPFHIYPIFDTSVRNISDNQPSASGILSWTNAVPAGGWLLADQYVLLDAQPISTDLWGIQIYTNNTVPPPGNDLGTVFVDPTLDEPNNADSDPSGLLLTGQPTTSSRLPLAWSIKDQAATPPKTADPNNEDDKESFQWLFVTDKAAPIIDREGEEDDSEAFADGAPYVTLRNTSGIHVTQKPEDFFKVLAPDPIYFQANFKTAAAQSTYRTTLFVEFYFE